MRGNYSRLPSPRSDAERSLHVTQNSSRHKLMSYTTWERSRTEIRLTLPNALEISRPTYKTAERNASSCEYKCTKEANLKERDRMTASLPS